MLLLASTQSVPYKTKYSLDLVQFGTLSIVETALYVLLFGDLHILETLLLAINTCLKEDFIQTFFQIVILPSSIQIDTIDLYRLGRLWLWYKSAEFRTSEIEPPRPLPSIGLSHLPVRKENDQGFRFSIDLYGNCRTKPREASEIRRVTDAWNTPARLVSFPTVRYV